MQKKLACLDRIDSIADTFDVNYAGMLRLELLRDAAAQRPSYWMRAMRPEVTLVAANWCRARIQSSF